MCVCVCKCVCAIETIIIMQLLIIGGPHTLNFFRYWFFIANFFHVLFHVLPGLWNPNISWYRTRRQALMDIFFVEELDPLLPLLGTALLQSSIFSRKTYGSKSYSHIQNFDAQ